MRANARLVQGGALAGHFRKSLTAARDHASAPRFCSGVLTDIFVLMLENRVRSIRTRGEAAQYIAEVRQKICAAKPSR